MTKIYQLPTSEDKQSVHDLINDFAHGKLSRNDMMKMIANIITKYKTKSFPVFGYSVSILQWYKDIPVINIQSARVSDHCPTCDSGIGHAKYLRTEKENFGLNYDIISVTCLECGCVYALKAPNGRTEISERR
ncbi:hypothetical protein [Desulfosporosinus hippei]|uniref:Uncharacterized protein n=1 Tax=Desulfosporosinus hippei DSM 8344 TaxID=1121419 RepID=A0A1G7ULX0_9FIRM|nr:hypothetical protein [Desulfosporosinus hippei]SDG48605.1 hypothetical protein SAMN05443529_103186 [Desulfosporosinus hippei DSM 8344]